jgi:translation elongation factor P/translation initiation factor 5A
MSDDERTCDQRQNQNIWITKKNLKYVAEHGAVLSIVDSKTTHRMELDSDTIQETLIGDQCRYLTGRFISLPWRS